MLSTSMPRGLCFLCVLCSLSLVRSQEIVEPSVEETDVRAGTSVSSSRKSTTTSNLVSRHQRPCDDSDWEIHPVLCEWVMRAEKGVEAFAREAYEWAERHHQLVGASFLKSRDDTPSSTSDADDVTHSHDPPSQLLRGSVVNPHADSESNAIKCPSLTVQQLPVVFAHGMGDSCFNTGFEHIVQKVADLLHTYAVCVPTGDTQAQDTKNGYFLSMDDSVDAFAAKVAQDTNLQGGFHAIGFSQGANVIRGYMARHNSPPVHTFLSVNGVNAGVGAVPYCRPSSTTTTTATSQDFASTTSLCDLLMEQASRAAYTNYAQQHSFQANYWRDPRPSEQETYRSCSQLAAWNNEVNDPAFVNETLKLNWSKTSKFVWVLATDDEMVWPKEGEHWGAPDPNDPFEHVLPRTETDWYRNDLFGLRTAEEQGKNAYETFVGDHLQFSEQDFDRWIDTYLRQSPEGRVAVAVQ